MVRRPPRSTRTDTLFPYTTLFRSLPQEVALLDASIEDNISRFQKTPDARAIVEAARAASVHEMIVRLPVGYRRSEEHTSELQSLMRISYAVFCLKKKRSPLCNTHTHHPLILTNRPTHN